MSKIKVELIENFLVVWNPAEGSQLYKSGFYGKPLGIAKPKIPEFKVPSILDLMEGVYLAEKGTIEIREAGKKTKVGLKALKEQVGVNESETIRRALSAWLRKHGAIAKSGRKRAATRRRP